MNTVKTFFFWNNRENVEYFKNKPADYRIRARLTQLKESSSKTMSALDLGCGGGRHTELLIQLGFETSIVDINPAMISCTKRRVGREKLRSIKKASLLRLPFHNESFNAVIATGVLHQVRNIQEYDTAIKELSRILKPNGIVCLNVFTNKKLDSAYIKLKPAFTYKTKEGLIMTLLSKRAFYEMMQWHDLRLECELSEDIVEENTGIRSVLRCNFIKSTN